MTTTHGLLDRTVSGIAKDKNWSMLGGILAYQTNLTNHGFVLYESVIGILFKYIIDYSPCICIFYFL